MVCRASQGQIFVGVGGIIMTLGQHREQAHGVANGRQELILLSQSCHGFERAGVAAEKNTISRNLFRAALIDSLRERKGSTPAKMDLLSGETNFHDFGRLRSATLLHYELHSLVCQSVLHHARS